MSLAKQWALVTGASSGIGKSCAYKLAKDGAFLVLWARRQERLEEIQSDLKKKFPETKVIVQSVDLLKIEDIQSALNELTTKGIGIEILINNAGLALGTQKFQEGSFSDWEIMFNTNVRALLFLTRELLPSFILRKSGYIINLGSVAGRWVYPGGAIYCASKHAVRALSEGLRMDLLGTGVRVTNIEPGMVETEFSEVRYGDPIKAKAVYQGMTPLTGEDVADTILWCLNRPKHINVQELVLFPTDQAGIRDVSRRG